MTLLEFSNYAYEKAEEYGISRYKVSTMACNHGLHDKNQINYTIQAFDSISRNFITARQHNPSSALNEFEIKLKAHFKVYSQEQQDIEI